MPYYVHGPASCSGLSGSLSWPGKQLPSQPPRACLRQTHLVAPPGAPPRPERPLNGLYLGDNLAVMGRLLDELRGTVQLIYVDPPFATGKTFKRRLRIPGASPQSPKRFVELPSYGDRWAGSSFLQMSYERLALMRDLLAPEGTIYLHLDWRSVHHVKLIMDELFGADRFLNQIVWLYHGPSPIASAFKRKHDVLLVYTRGRRYYFDADAVRMPYDPVTRLTFKSPKAGFGKAPDLERGKVPEDWWYFPVVARLHRERLGFETQKPEALLERIIRASSRPGDLVADLFCGSGTTLAVAQRLGRRWLGCDASAQALAVTTARLVRQGSGSFAVFQAQEVSPAPGGAATAPSAAGAAQGGTWQVGFQRVGERLRACVLGPVSSAVESQGVAVIHEASRELEYWCVDPDYRGAVLRPSCWAVAERRGLAAELWLELPRRHSARLCVELCEVSGRRWRLVYRWAEVLAALAAGDQPSSVSPRPPRSGAGHAEMERVTAGGGAGW